MNITNMNARIGAPSPRPSATIATTQGVIRLFLEMGLAPICEFNLANGRRADVAAVDRKGKLVIAEVKSCKEDFVADEKWSSYLGFCDTFYFAGPEDFPFALLPETEGVIAADAYGAAVLRPAQTRPLSAARRKATLLRFARQAAMRSALSVQ